MRRLNYGSVSVLALLACLVQPASAPAAKSGVFDHAKLFKPETVSQANQIIQEMERAHAAGLGAVQLEGQMLDEAVVKWALRTVGPALKREAGALDKP